jgi:hypothetical protein
MADTSPPGSSSTSRPALDDTPPAPGPVLRTIEDTDEVSRHVFAPRMIGAADEFVWHEIFQFPSERGLAESVALRAVVPKDEDVHRLGCEKQNKDRERERARGRSGPTYRGCTDAIAGRIRSQSSTRGHGFSVTHVPEEGDWHGHVTVVLAPGSTKLSKQDKDDVRELMAEVFGPLKPHACA